MQTFNLLITKEEYLRIKIGLQPYVIVKKVECHMGDLITFAYSDETEYFSTHQLYKVLWVNTDERLNDCKIITIQKKGE